jgi:phosphatidate cytidylyltransferase
VADRPLARRPVAAPPPAASGRDLPVAVAVGLLLAAVFIGAIMWRPVAVLAFITVLFGLGAVEFYDKVGEKGYRPAVVPGIAACVAAPLAAYWLGPGDAPARDVVRVHRHRRRVHRRPQRRGRPAPERVDHDARRDLDRSDGLVRRPDPAVLDVPRIPRSAPTRCSCSPSAWWPTTSVPSSWDRRRPHPVAQWISPSKTVEGLHRWCAVHHRRAGGRRHHRAQRHLDVHRTPADPGIVISMFAPMGDLVESMFKRNLDVKDFGSIVKGHGGVLDRFDGFLFTLPASTTSPLVLEPWFG